MFRVSTWGDELISLKSRKYLIYIFSIKDFKSIVVQVKIKMTVNHACVIFFIINFFVEDFFSDVFDKSILCAQQMLNFLVS